VRVCDAHGRVIRSPWLSEALTGRRRCRWRGRSLGSWLQSLP
jgi:hypothetical protein